MSETATPAGHDDDTEFDAFWREQWAGHTDWTLIRQLDDENRPMLRLGHPKMTDSVRVEPRDAFTLARHLATRAAGILLDRAWQAIQRKPEAGSPVPSHTPEVR